jgi:hypothetical protein
MWKSFTETKVQLTNETWQSERLCRAAENGLHYAGVTRAEGVADKHSFWHDEDDDGLGKISEKLLESWRQWQTDGLAVESCARRGRPPATNWIKQRHQRDANGLQRNKRRGIRAWVPLYPAKSTSASRRPSNSGEEIRPLQGQPGGVEWCTGVVCDGKH